MSWEHEGDSDNNFNLFTRNDPQGFFKKLEKI